MPGPWPTPPGAARRRAERAYGIAEVLRRLVVSGAYPDGVLPDERTLIAEFGTTRNTVREALDLLRCEGLVERVPGTGTVVTAAKYPHGLNRLTGLAETLHEHGDVTNEVRAAGPVRAPATVARRLHMSEGAQVVYIERVRRLNGLPLSLDLTYLAPDVGTPLLGRDLEHLDVFGLIEQTSGHRLGVAEISVEAVNADAHASAVLEVPRGAALLVVERLSHLDTGRPVDLEFIRFRGDRLSMTARIPRSSPT
ncbi:GntR family transcriptional regulator [Yinghuangia sp. ASG 101]|uniref:GntR family transcriptional regulator n=1 Tax=Yinghuangia sp. ASG 101 TaxID=2896848 RepID=UPI001E2DD114|nr:GntR family transcriptional regulator [Yinghuangia sp. ASG 101]UGQ15305.1 GntR family transcriptional regulator [Yinghuangia sp. ASG 101]